MVKLFLLRSEAWGAVGTKSDGLRPEIAMEIGARARAAGVRVAAHVESVRDAKLAAAAGVTLLAHMPGYGLRSGVAPDPYTPTDADIAAIAAAGIRMTPTLGLLYADKDDAAGAEKLRTWKREQLSRWKAGGVGMLYGSDNYFDIESELRAMIASKLWTNAELIHLLARDTPRWIAPGRNVGDLNTGSEATFVVLGGNPLDDPAALFDVRRVYKRGVMIWEQPPRNAPPPPP
jgi:imidazolonepropionase-like amidohydrolase